jgi:beta-lactamase class A
MLADLRHNLERIAKGIDNDWAIYVKFMASGEEIALNADISMDTMSVIKIPLLVTLFLEKEAGHIQLDQRIILKKRHKRFGTGILQMMEDGFNFSLRDAAVLMIVLSDNTATDICYEAVGGPDKVTEAMRRLGLASINVTGQAFDWFRALASEMDPEYAMLSPEDLFTKWYPPLSPVALANARENFHFNGNCPFSLANVRDIGRLLEMIWLDKCANQASCEEMRRILRLQILRTRIPKYLFGAIVAHKTGDFDPFIANDVGVIEPYGRPPIIVCFFSTHHRGIWANLEDGIARMSEKVWEYGLHFHSETEGNPSS